MYVKTGRCAYGRNSRPKACSEDLVMKKFTRTTFCAALLLLIASESWALQYAGNQKPQLVYGSNQINFGVTTQPKGTCVYFGRHFRFDATTPGGRNILTILLSAVASGKNVDVWYAHRPVPGKNQTNGCNEGNLAVVKYIGIR